MSPATTLDELQQSYAGVTTQTQRLHWSVVATLEIAVRRGSAAQLPTKSPPVNLWWPGACNRR